MNRKKVDFLVIGSGIAGLSFALKVSDKYSVCVINKNVANETNTSYAQGGIASVWDKDDSPENHFNDTMIAGSFLNDEKIVRIVVNEAKDRVKELIEWGAKFDKSGKEYDLAIEGGHSAKRILHHKDITGREIQRALLEKCHKQKNIEILDDFFALDIITQHHLGEKITRKTPDIECHGAYVMDKNSGDVHTILSKKTILATGGVGMVYASSTNPVIATGDGISMAYRAKAEVKDMEFIQFHPTALYNPGSYPSFLVSEAVRGFGGILRNHLEEDFMVKYDERGSLAPRDVVARSIDSEMKTYGIDHVFLDCTHLNMREFKAHFPNIYAQCIKIGIDPAFDFIPVVPSQHYCCGGIKVDEFAQSTIKHLYAIGESACTGLHGANRLASNSLLEGLIFGHRAALHGLEDIENIHFNISIPDWDASGTEATEEMVLITQSIKEVQTIMSTYVGILRSDLRLKRALDRLEIIYRETESLYLKTTPSAELFEARNIINAAYLIIKSAMQRKESIGLHYSLDHPVTEIK